MEKARGKTRPAQRFREAMSEASKAAAQFLFIVL
jgi:hypothetical protein